MPKIKTRRAAAKRFQLTGSGKFKRRRQNLRHILTKKAPGRKMRLGQVTLVDKTNEKAVRRCSASRGCGGGDCGSGKRAACAGSASACACRQGNMPGQAPRRAQAHRAGGRRKPRHRAVQFRPAPGAESVDILLPGGLMPPPLPGERRVPPCV